MQFTFMLVASKVRSLKNIQRTNCGRTCLLVQLIGLVSKKKSDIEALAPLYSVFHYCLVLTKGTELIIKTDYGEPRSLKFDFTLRLYFM